MLNSAMSSRLEILLLHPEQEMCDAFAKHFDNLPNVTISKVRFEDLQPHSCFVTAANSFGQMSAGIDAAVSAYFGPSVVEAVQLRIMDEYLGEQPVGTAFVLATSDTRIPFLCHAPTMRVPASIDGTSNVYLATWAAFLAIHRHNVSEAEKIESVAFPAFGTGFGDVSFDEAARQMALAYANYLEPPHRLDWTWVTERHRKLCYVDGKKIIRW